MPTNFIECRSGQRFTPLDPHAADVNLTDIAHALSHQCRFSGHTRVHYSVAEHSVRVSRLIEAWKAPRHVQLWGLMHDASEAYLVDIPTPLKSHPSFAFYRRAEVEVMHAICARFGMPVEVPYQVTAADGVLLATEARDLMPFRPEHWAKLDTQPLEERIEPWSPAQARSEFISRFVEVGV